jgi:pyruvate formate lyase activating enzyme
MIFDIQHYAVHDGPGIRTLVFFKGCPLSCPWCSNPESQSFLPELKHVPARCRACGSCVSACSNGAISFTQWRPAIDRARCCECGSWTCVDACDAGALSCVGQRMTVSETMARIRADVPFYENSGGGATFSGGEPFAPKASTQSSKLADMGPPKLSCGWNRWSTFSSTTLRWPNESATVF